jgi:hypothetical protein
LAAFVRGDGNPPAFSQTQLGGGLGTGAFVAASWRSPLWTLAKVAAVFTPTNQQPRDFAPQWCGFSYGFGLFTAQESQGQGLDFGPRAGVLNG